MLAASISHWLGTFHVTIMTNFQQIGSYTLKSTQSMWIACCKHYTLIGYFSFSITHIGKKFTHWLGTFQIIAWKVPNQCELLVASISHRLGCFESSSQIFHWFLKYTTQSMWNACCKHFTLIGKFPYID